MKGWAEPSPFIKHATQERSLFYETMTGTNSNTLLVEFFHLTAVDYRSEPL